MAMVPRESWCRKSTSLALGRPAVYALLEADVIPALRDPREFVLHRRVVLGKRLKEKRDAHATAHEPVAHPDIASGGAISLTLS